MKKYILYSILIIFGVLICRHAESDTYTRKQPFVWIVEFDGPVNPGMATYVVRGIEKAADNGAQAVIIQLDTPGGLGSSMRRIVKAILNAPVPVVVYVAPEGAGAASAGVMITVAAHIAAMAPGTNIGAAHPVTTGGKDMNKTMSEKVVNDMASYGRGIAEEKGRNGAWVEKAIRKSVSITAKQALKKHVIDLIARDMDALLAKIDGKKVRLVTGTMTLHTKGAVRIHYRPNLRDRILKTISDPNISYILMMIGLAGMYFELAHPGAIFPGVIGGISLLLAFYSFQTLPVNYTGVLLILLGIIFFVAEIMVTSYGMLAIGGLASITLGSLMLFDNVKISVQVMMPTVVLTGGFFMTVAWLAYRAHRKRPMGGLEGLIGKRAEVKEWEGHEGTIFVHGEYWRAVSDDILSSGQTAEVVGGNGLVLRIKKI